MNRSANVVHCCSAALFFLAAFIDANAQQIQFPGEHAGAVMAASFVTDAERAVTVGSDQRVIFWDVPGGRVLQNFTQHTGPIYTLAVSGDGQTAATGCRIIRFESGICRDDYRSGGTQNRDRPSTVSRWLPTAFPY